MLAAGHGLADVVQDGAEAERPAATEIVGKRLIEYPNLIRYTADLFSRPHVAQTFALDEIKRHYYTTHDELNPKRIIPAGPLNLGFTDPPET